MVFYYYFVVILTVFIFIFDHIRRAFGLMFERQTVQNEIIGVSETDARRVNTYTYIILLCIYIYLF